MVVLQPSGFGLGAPPHTKYNITTHLPTWDLIMSIRKGDLSSLSKVTHIYPRFMPWSTVKELIDAISRKLGLSATHGAVAFLDPESFAMVRSHAISPLRREHCIPPLDLIFKCVDIGSVRLFLTFFPKDKVLGAMGAWQNPGIGISTRLCETLLPHVDELNEVDCSWFQPAKPQALPEGPSHAKIRERIVELLRHGAIDPGFAVLAPRDVFLYPTGMAAIYRVHSALVTYRKGTVVMLGSLFHNTLHMLPELAKDGCKHFGSVDEDGLDHFSAWLDSETSHQRPVSYVFIEFPSNPMLVSADLRRIAALSKKHGFSVVIDDTIGSFANVDVLAQADVVITSLTKSFNGYSNAMGGSAVLNPRSPIYSVLSTVMASTHRNELFAVDADVLFRNSNDFLERSHSLNCNARAMADRLQREADDPESPVTRVHYPSVAPDAPMYRSFMRQSTIGMPVPGFGCLLSVDFEDVPTCAAFYDNLGFHHTPHLAGHRTLCLAFNAMVYNRTVEETAYNKTYGLLDESIRISAGLEKEADLIDTLEYALTMAREAKEKLAAAGEVEEELAAAVGATEVKEKLVAATEVKEEQSEG